MLVVAKALSPSVPADAQTSAAERPFAELYRQHAAFVWRILRRLGVPDDTLEDAVQEVFLVLHRRRDGLASHVSLRSWLFGTARRVAADARRGRHRHARRLQALAIVEGELRYERPVARAEAADLVHRFLDRLDPDKRMVFVLADIEGMTAPEIADALGVKLNTVYSRLRAARAEFERVVTDDVEERRS